MKSELFTFRRPFWGWPILVYRNGDDKPSYKLKTRPAHVGCRLTLHTAEGKVVGEFFDLSDKRNERDLNFIVNYIILSNG